MINCTNCGDPVQPGKICGGCGYFLPAPQADEWDSPEPEVPAESSLVHDEIVDEHDDGVPQSLKDEIRELEENKANHFRRYC